MQRNKSWHILHSIHKVNFKWIIDLNVRAKAIEVLDKNTGEKSQWPCVWPLFLKHTKNVNKFD